MNPAPEGKSGVTFVNERLLAGVTDSITGLLGGVSSLTGTALSKGLKSK